MQSASLKDLSPGETQRRIVVRLSRIWENKNMEQQVYELGFVVVDQQGDTIEGCVSTNRLHLFKEKLKEDSVYRLQSFMVSPARNKYRVVNHPYRIKLTKLTTMTQVVPEPENFPIYAHNARPFDILETRVGDNTLLSDVVVVVTRLTDIIPGKNDQDSRRNIYVKDGSDRQAIVTLWGPHAEQFDAEDLHEASSEDNIVVLFVSISVGRYAGMLAFKSTTLTRWYVNPSIAEAEVLRASLGGQHYIIDWQNHGTAKNELTNTTIHSLAKEEIEEIIGKRYKLNILIKEINNPHHWWYHGCKNCWKATTPAGNSFKCQHCQSTEEQKRYKISVNATDIEPNEEGVQPIAQFMFFGDSGVVLTGKEPTLLAATVRGRQNFVPPAIAAIVGKKCVVLAQVKQDSLDSDDGLIIFNVSKVELINSPEPTEPSSSHHRQETPDPLNPSQNLQIHSANDTSLQSTPVKDVLEATDSGIEEPSTTTEGKKRKATTTGNKATKRSGTTDKKGTSKELFPSKQNN